MSYADWIFGNPKMSCHHKLSSVRASWTAWNLNQRRRWLHLETGIKLVLLINDIFWVIFNSDFEIDFFTSDLQFDWSPWSDFLRPAPEIKPRSNWDPQARMSDKCPTLYERPIYTHWCYPLEVEKSENRI